MKALSERIKRKKRGGKKGPSRPSSVREDRLLSGGAGPWQNRFVDSSKRGNPTHEKRHAHGAHPQFAEGRR